MATNIQVSQSVWSELNGRKKPGESFDDVLQRVLEQVGEADARVDEAQLRERIDSLDWDETEYAKTDARVAVLAAMAAELARREIAGKQALRRVVIGRGHDIEGGTLQRLSADVLPLLPEVRSESQVYEWRA